MRKRSLTDVAPQPVTAYGSTGTSIQWLWGSEDGAPRFFMRRFVIEPGGKIGLHHHPEEHEIFFLGGTCRVFNDKGEDLLAKRGDALLVPPDEPHGYENTGSEPVEFLCMIPKLGK